jgi:hypothetical protein
VTLLVPYPFVQAMLALSVRRTYHRRVNCSISSHQHSSCPTAGSSVCFVMLVPCLLLLPFFRLSVSLLFVGSDMRKQVLLQLHRC